MIPLKNLIREAYPEYPRLSEVPDILIRGLECDSRKIEKDFLFVMVRGEKSDGRLFAEEAIRRGAVALAVDSEGFVSAPVPFVKVSDSRLAMAKFAAAF